jgi:hypothetical protein
MGKTKKQGIGGGVIRLGESSVPLLDKGYPEFPFKETGSSATKPSQAFKIREYQSDQPSQQGLRLCLCLAYMNKTRFDRSKRQGKYFLLDK